MSAKGERARFSRSNLSGSRTEGHRCDLHQVLPTESVNTMSLKTPLYDSHVAAGGKMVEFASYALPIHYGSVIKEHHSVRQSAGMFDVSHMTIVDVQGENAKAWLRGLFSNDVAKLQHGQALYSCMCLEDGGVIDDLIVYSIDEHKFRVIVNAATREKDLAWFSKHAHEGVGVNAVDNLALVAVQGPDAVNMASEVLEQFSINSEWVHTLKRFSAMQSGDWFIARTGYTGEDGLEIALPSKQAASFWDKLLEKGVSPAGLGARDTLRLEAGMSLYGNDLDEQHSPVESGIAWTVDLTDNTRDFIGRAVLEAQKTSGTDRRQIGLTLEGKGVLRQGQSVELDGQHIGAITSGTFSPTLQKTIALARVNAPVNDVCEVRIRDKSHAARIIPVPFLSGEKL